ncbi:MAG: hypothetical protein GX638_01065 [Crenarchaeota archaeon]|nr:hypothetical protein [Thermoproteota archaeon]
MGKRFVGAIFCLISAILFASRYIATAIFLSSATAYDKELFEGVLENVGTNLLWLSIISLIVGIVYLIWAEVRNMKDKIEI